MTPDLVANILAWRSTNTSSMSGGAESDTYMNVQPPYTCKNAPFETVDELRLIYSMDMDTLYGEDANLNGILDPNENDGDVLPPTDNMDGQLDAGLFEYATVYSREPSTYAATNSAGAVTNCRATQQHHHRRRRHKPAVKPGGGVRGGSRRPDRAARFHPHFHQSAAILHDPRFDGG